MSDVFSDDAIFVLTHLLTAQPAQRLSAWEALQPKWCQARHRDPGAKQSALRARADALLGGPPPANHAACRRAFNLSDGGRAPLPAPLRPGLGAPLPPREPSSTADDGPRAWGNCSHGEAGGWTGVAGADLRAHSEKRLHDGDGAVLCGGHERRRPLVVERVRVGAWQQ